MSKRKTPVGSDDEWYPTAQEMSALQPISEVDPELLQAHRQKRGRPRLSQKKQNISLRLEPWILDAYRAMGKGWQSRINAALAKALQDAPAT